MNHEERARLVKAALAVADDLDSRLYPAAGIIRQLAQVVATTAVTAGCPVCGEPVPIGAKGRPRMYCSTSCKQKASRTRTADTVTIVAAAVRPAAQDDLSRVTAYADPVGEEAVNNVLRAG